MAPPNGTTEEILIAYCNLMEELKARQAVVLKILTDAREGRFAFPPYILGELCFLQLRMMCELIALGCLLVHKDVPAARTTRMQKAYAADWIVNRLTELHPSFYPLAGVQTLDEAARVIRVDPNTKPHLTKDKLLELYAECGAVLHRGNLKGILAADPKHMDLLRAAKWTAQITQLLDHHQIPLLDERYQIWVGMQMRADGKVHAVLVEHVPDTQPE
jgi:hypothetical protein